MSSLAVSGIAPFLDLAGLLLFVKKISIYLIAGATFYFLRTTKQGIDIKHNSDPSARDKTFNEILADRDARLDEIERNLQTYHKRVTTEFESINGSILTIQNKINQYYAVVQAQSAISPEIRIEPIEDTSVQQSDENQSEASSGSSQRSFSDITSEIWNQFKNIFDRITTERGCSLDEMCTIVAVDILNLGVGKLSKDIIKNYYRRINDLKGSNLDKIGAWIDSKQNNNE